MTHAAPVEPVLVRRRKAVVAEARETGLFDGGLDRVGARLHHRLLAIAKAKSGLSSTTELLEYALAKIAIEDDWAETFAALEGTVSPDLDLEF